MCSHDSTFYIQHITQPQCHPLFPPVLQYSNWRVCLFKECTSLRVLSLSSSTCVSRIPTSCCQVFFSFIPRLLRHLKRTTHLWLELQDNLFIALFYFYYMFDRCSADDDNSLLTFFSKRADQSSRMCRMNFTCPLPSECKVRTLQFPFLSSRHSPQDFLQRTLAR